MNLWALRNMCRNFTQDTNVRICAKSGEGNPVILFNGKFTSVPEFFKDLDIDWFIFRENNTVIEIYY